MNRMEFGLFMPPLHYVGQNPTRALHRDLETIEYVEELGFQEAWIGEHHSGGAEIIGPSDIFISAAIQRTKRIRIGTGVVSLPYHHPFHVAERAVMLDHLSYGRTMLGVGPGSLPTDAAMIGVPWPETRKRMRESWQAIHHLLTCDEPLTMETDWFKLDDAMLHLRPYSNPAMEIAFTGMESPFGPSLAGEYGATLLSLSGTSATGFAALGRHWAVVEEQAAANGQSVSRDNWAVIAQVHVAETREQARAEVAGGLPAFAEYTGTISERPFDSLAPRNGIPLTPDEIIDTISGTGTAVIGSPDDVISMIKSIQEITGGFGRLLLFVGSDWAPQEAHFRSLELFAREVMPVFQGSSAPQIRGAKRGLAARPQRLAEQRAAIEAASASYQSPTK